MPISRRSSPAGEAGVSEAASGGFPLPTPAASMPLRGARPSPAASTRRIVAAPQRRLNAGRRPRGRTSFEPAEPLFPPGGGAGPPAPAPIEGHLRRPPPPHVPDLHPEG